jgi:Protein of unknown function (DUF1549)/Protein of unknown function (DUF1553)
MMFGLRLILLAVVGSIRLVAAGVSAPPALRLVPAETTLSGAGATQRFVVLAKGLDGLERDVTSQCRFTTKSTSKIAVELEGRVTGLADGDAILRVEYQGAVAEAAVRVRDVRRPRTSTFAWDVEAVLTRNGCNGSGCHGGVKGRGGLKLSLHGSDPREDYRWIVKGGTYQVLTDAVAPPIMPRVNQSEPGKSLLLMKPTFAVPHGGGYRIEPGSRDYKTLAEWIVNSAPYTDEGPRVERIEPFPGDAVLLTGSKQQMIVTAHLVGGEYRDVTESVLYESLNPEVLTIDERGRAEARRPGEAAVLVRAPGRVATARIAVIPRALARYPDVERRNFIDEFVFAKLQKLHILPSELSGDAEFLRRVCLDLTGTLPPRERVDEFLADREPRKREKLVDRLLETPEYVDYWTFRFGDLFRVALHPNGGNPKYSQAYGEWLRRAIAENRPYDEIAGERIAAQGYDGPSRHYLPILQPPLPQDAASEQVRAFLGRRLDCAQCHDHPFENWTQNQFWGLAAFFRRLTFYWYGDIGVETIVSDDADGYSRRGNMGRVMNPRTNHEVEPSFLDGTALPAEERKDPRRALARWITAHPYFAEAAANRIWSHFFSRGIVDPVDDFRTGNPATHPELLAALAEDFRSHRYDLKHLMRRIVSSRTYQLSSAPNETNRDDEINYSRALPRRLDAEILLDAVSRVTETTEVFKLPNGGMAPPGTRAIELDEPDMYPCRFLELHGRPSRATLPERSAKASLGQTLHQLAGETYTDKLARDGGRVDRLVSGRVSSREMINELYLAALSRRPNSRELGELEAALDAATRRTSRRQAVEDLLWAILSSEEFTHNH